MKFVRVLKATNEWFVDKISETDWVIETPNGTYKNSDGKEYHFKTKEDALEELDYLRAEHKFDKKSRNLTRSERHNRMMNGIFEYKNKIDNAKAEFLKSKGVSEEELEYLKKNTGLGRDALDEKLIELGLHKEFWNTQKNASKKVASKKVKSGESYGWIVNPEDAFDKLSLWVEAVGAEAALDDLARAMGPDELSENLAFIFRNNDFKEGCSDYEEEVDERWEVDGFTYDTEEDARLEFKNVCESEPSEDHVLMLNDEEVEFYKGK